MLMMEFQGKTVLPSLYYFYPVISSST